MLLNKEILREKSMVEGLGLITGAVSDFLTLSKIEEL